jgi:hypothetical protein
MVSAAKYCSVVGLTEWSPVQVKFVEIYGLVRVVRWKRSDLEHLEAGYKLDEFDIIGLLGRFGLRLVW